MASHTWCDHGKVLKTNMAPITICEKLLVYILNATQESPFLAINSYSKVGNA